MVNIQNIKQDLDYVKRLKGTIYQDDPDYYQTLDRILQSVDLLIEDYEAEKYLHQEMRDDLKKGLDLNPFNDSQIDDLLIEIDLEVRSYDRFEYGLPVYNKQERNILRQVVKEWIIDNVTRK